MIPTAIVVDKIVVDGSGFYKILCGGCGSAQLQNLRHLLHLKQKAHHAGKKIIRKLFCKNDFCCAYYLCLYK
jgi:hypothetical protein